MLYTHTVVDDALPHGAKRRKRRSRGAERLIAAIRGEIHKLQRMEIRSAAAMSVAPGRRFPHAFSEVRPHLLKEIWLDRHGP